jgi:hypothetical protein
MDPPVPKVQLDRKDHLDPVVARVTRAIMVVLGLPAGKAQQVLPVLLAFMDLPELKVPRVPKGQKERTVPLEGKDPLVYKDPLVRKELLVRLDPMVRLVLKVLKVLLEKTVFQDPLVCKVQPATKDTMVPLVPLALKVLKVPAVTTESKDLPARKVPLACKAPLVHKVLQVLKVLMDQLVLKAQLDLQVFKDPLALKVLKVPLVKTVRLVPLVLEVKTEFQGLRVNLVTMVPQVQPEQQVPREFRVLLAPPDKLELKDQQVLKEIKE